MIKWSIITRISFPLQKKKQPTLGLKYSMASQNPDTEAMSACEELERCKAREQELEEERSWNVKIHAGSAISFTVGIAAALGTKNPRLAYFMALVPAFSFVPFYFSYTNMACLKNDLETCRRERMAWFYRCQNEDDRNLADYLLRNMSAAGCNKEK